MSDESLRSESLAEISIPRIKKFAAEAFTLRAFGFSMNHLWIFTAMLNVTLLAPRSTGPFLAMTDVAGASMIALVCTLLIGALAADTVDKLANHRFGAWAPAVILAIGTLSMPLAGESSLGSQAFFVLAAGLTGIGSGLLSLFWGRAYGRLGGPIAAAETSVAYLLAGLLTPIAFVLPFPALVVFVAALPFGSTGIVIREFGKQKRAEATAEPEGSTPPSQFFSLDDRRMRRLAIKLISSSFVFGTVVSLVNSIALPPYGASNGMVLLASSIVSAACVLSVLFFSKSFDMAFSYRPVLLFMALGCIVVPFLGNHVIYAYLLSMIGYQTFRIMNWVILSDASYRLKGPSLLIFGGGSAAVTGGVLMGSALWSLINDYNLYDASALSSAMVFALLVVYALAFTEKDVSVLTRQIDPALSSTCESVCPNPQCAAFRPLEPELSFDRKIEILAARHDVTGRTYEVMKLVAYGRTGARIEQELYMARGTLNTHMRRLYQKLDVHSRQELQDKIAEITIEELV